MGIEKKERRKKGTDKKSGGKILTPFQKMLLSGPVIEDDQAKEYERIISKSRKWKV